MSIELGVYTTQVPVIQLTESYAIVLYSINLCILIRCLTYLLTLNITGFASPQLPVTVRKTLYFNTFILNIVIFIIDLLNLCNFSLVR